MRKHGWNLPDRHYVTWENLEKNLIREIITIPNKYKENISDKRCGCVRRYKMKPKGECKATNEILVKQILCLLICNISYHPILQQVSTEAEVSWQVVKLKKTNNLFIPKISITMLTYVYYYTMKCGKDWVQQALVYVVLGSKNNEL